MVARKKKGLVVSLEFKLDKIDQEEKGRLIRFMWEYSNMIKYALMSLRSSRDDEKKCYSIIRKRFSRIGARMVNHAVEDARHVERSLFGLGKGEVGLTMRFDYGNSFFEVVDGFVYWNYAVEHEKKGKLAYSRVKLMPQRNLRYKYYCKLFSTTKEYCLPSRLILRKGQLYLKVTVERERLVANSAKPTVFVGVDINAFWIGKRAGHPLVTATLAEDGSFACKEKFYSEWSEIPVGIRARQRKKEETAKYVTNQMGLIVKDMMERHSEFNAIYVLEDLTGLTLLKGPYSKFAYQKFRSILQTKTLNVMLVSPAYSSQTCWKCGGKLEVKGRTVYCSKCYPNGFNRDLNSAIVVAQRGLQEYLHRREAALKEQEVTPIPSTQKHRQVSS